MSPLNPPQSRIIRHVPIEPNLSPDKAPSVSLHVIAKNAESVLGRLLDNVGPYVKEWRIILNDTTDASLKVISAKSACYPNTEVFVKEVTSDSHPDLYMPDSKETYLEGKPLANETFDGPFTDGPLLCDWAALRNLGWVSGCDYMLFLDADDVVEDPQRLPGLVQTLAAGRVDLAATKYVFGRAANGIANSVTYRERLALNKAVTRWTGRTHETLLGGLRRVLVEDAFLVTDLKDNWGRGVRIPGRCFKVLYREARLAEWVVPSRHLAYLVQESPGMMPIEWVTDCLLPCYQARATSSEEVAWVLSMVGEQWEARGDDLKASVHYARAVAAYPSAKAAFRLSRAMFKMGEWRECIEAHANGVSFLDYSQVLDAGPVYADSTKLMVAQAHFELGDKETAKRVIDEVAAVFAGDSTVIQLRDAIHGR